MTPTSVGASVGERLTFDVPEIAKMLGINRIAAYELAKQKDFPTVRIGRRIVVPKDAFFSWLDEQATAEK